MTKFDTILFTIFIFLIPIFGKSLDSIESIIFYIIPIVFSTSLIFPKSKFQISKKSIILQSILIFSLFINLIFSQVINFSYYHFFAIICTILITNISILYIKQKDFLKYLIIFSFIYSIVFLLNKVGLIHLSPKSMGDNFIRQYWGHSYISDILVLSIPVLIYQRVNPFLIIFQILVLILTNSRSSLFILPLIILLIPQINIKQKIFYIASTIIAFLLFIALIKFNYLSNKNIIGNRFDYWSQAVEGFKNHPIIGNGQNTFFLVSNQFRQNMNQSAYAHNSILTLFSDFGIFISIFILYVVFKQLKYQFKNNYLFFLISLSLLTNSLFDATLNSYGMIIIFGYLLFSSQKTSKKNISNYSKFFIILVTIFLFMHTITRTFSDYFYFIKNDYKISLNIDPFNINPYLKNINKNNISPIFKNNESVYKQIITDSNLPDNEKYFFTLLSLNPKDNLEYYQKLLEYYQKTNNLDKLDILINTIDNNFNEEEIYSSIALSFSKQIYEVALTQTKTNPQRAIKYLQLNIKLNPKLSYYYIELANLYNYINEPEKAKTEFEKCINIPQSKDHCLYYQTNKKYEEPGSYEMKNTILNYSGAPK